MADRRRSLSDNVAGSYFVDSGCIDCGACRWIADESFDHRGGYSRVYAQPETDDARLACLKALIACPTGSIGTSDKYPDTDIKLLFPQPVDGPVYYCGYHSAASYGAASWFIRRDGGNVLVDSPRFSRLLVRRLEGLGGVDYMFLTHRDDVADHELFHAHFGCQRILHADDAFGALNNVEILLRGEEPVHLAPDLLAVPVPGHTRGSVCLLFGGKYLFTGDHLDWDRDAHELRARRSVCWYDWEKQTASMRRLAGYCFEWVLPGHGEKCHLPGGLMAASLANCIERMALS